MTAGRPHEFKHEYCEQAYKLCLLMGATDEQIANFLGYDESTINRWKNEFPEFKESIKKGKCPADTEVAASLFKRSTGYIKKTRKPMVVSNGNGLGSRIEIAEYDEEVLPDPVSAFYWLNNRQRGNWSNKVTPNDDEDEVPVIKVQIEAIDGSKAKGDNTATEVPTA